MTWSCALTLGGDRARIDGSAAVLTAAVRRGADLRIGTEFRHNEHIDVRSSSAEPIVEVAQFAVTYLVDDRWVAGIMSLRQPVDLPAGFGPRPSMSFFLYNQDGTQAIARPHLDGQPAPSAPGPSPVRGPQEMPKYRAADAWDEGTNAPSTNFVYDFDVYRYFVHDRWREVLSHDEGGRIRSGSVDDLAAAFGQGRAVKVGVAGLCASLAAGGDPVHEVFVEAGSCYYYTQQRLFIAGSHPVIRVRPAVPMRYASRGWDFGWLLLRTDGAVVYRRCDPYTLRFGDDELRCAVRWFVA